MKFKINHIEYETEETNIKLIEFLKNNKLSFINNNLLKVEIENKMNDYLKTHGCAILPLVFACYKVDGNLKLLKRDKEYSL